MAKIPKGAKVEFHAGRQPLPKGAAVTYEGPTPEEAAVMPMPEPTRMERIVNYIKATPGRIADTATSSNTVPSAMTGATMGALPYLSAAIDTAPAALRKLAGGGGNLGAEFDRNLRRRKPLYDAAVEDQPVANFVGMAASPNPLGKAGAVGRVVGATGAGALSSYLGTDGPEAMDAGGDGAMLAGGLQAGAELLPSALRPLAKGLRSAAGEKAVQAVGARAGITDRLAKKGITPADVPELGNKFLDEGLVPTGLNPFRNPLQQTQDRATALMSRSGDEIGGTMKRASAAAPFDYNAAQNAAASKLDNLNASEQAASGKAQGLVDLIGEQGKLTPGSFEGANSLKSSAWRGANFSADAADAPALFRRTNSGLKESIENQVGSALGQDAKAGLIASNRRFGVASDAEELSRMAQSRDVQKQQFSPTRAAIASAAGLGTGGALTGGLGGAGVGGAAAAFLNDAIVKRGPNVAARAYRAGSQGAEALAGKTLPPNVSAATGNLLEDYLRPKDDEEREEGGAAWFTGR